MIVAPIPDLVVLRATSGLFYDLAGGNAGIRNEVSDRFELYCTQLAKKILPSHDIERSFSYKFAGNQHDSPDVLVKTNKELRIIFECKAARMAYQARFAQNPLVDDPRGYKELAKGVFQIWRFVSHQRREESNEMVAHPDLVGVVLTLDTWLIMSAEIQNDVIEMAKVFLKERDPEILEKDLVPISFFSIADFEQTAERCSEDSFFDAVKGLSTSRFQGWQLYNVHKAVATEDARINSFPFEDRMSTVLPWWDKLPVRP